MSGCYLNLRAPSISAHLLSRVQNQEDYRRGLHENALLFDLTEEMGKEKDRLNREYIHLIGVFSASYLGTYPCPNGQITKIQRFNTVSSVNNPSGEALDDTKPPMVRPNPH